MATSLAEEVVTKNPYEPAAPPVVEKSNPGVEDKPVIEPPPAEVVKKNPEAAEPPLASVAEKPRHVVEDKPVVAPQEVAEKPSHVVEDKPVVAPQAVAEKPSHVVEEKPVVAPPPAEAAKPVATDVPEPDPKKSSKGSLDRDTTLAKLEGDKKLSYIKAWEDNEKSKVENRTQKKVAEIAAWENTKKASFDAELRKLEEKLESEKAYYAERVKNKVALIHKEAEEKRATIEAARRDEIFRAAEAANTYRTTKQIPKKSFGCF
ncbi:Remorin [Dorcoceras hygrometricum]|uniref:Remorin n=1 Tax=Dorcoceras hygrometricum TaxID=472368 RepID=A0A2Z7AK07_9LAMI|nr:Remorin [Dorcoceras hygrometricum]